MKRFLLVLALVGVAGATYVATAPGSQTAGPSGAQFRALKHQVTVLRTQLKQVKALAVLDGGLIYDCMAVAVPIDQRGDAADTPATYGYSYADPSINSGDPFLTTALDIAPIDDPGALWITGGDSTCGSDLGTAGRKAARLAGIHLHHVAPHPFGALRH